PRSCSGCRARGSRPVCVVSDKGGLATRGVSMWDWLPSWWGGKGPADADRRLAAPSGPPARGDEAPGRPAPLPTGRASEKERDRVRTPGRGGPTAPAAGPRVDDAVAPSDLILGIDLGTTHSVVAVARDGRVVVIPNQEGERLTPSVVAFTEGGDVLVG